MSINNLTVNEEKLKNLYLRNVSLGLVQGPITGIPSVDKPWLKYYEERAILTEDFEGSALDYLKMKNKNHLASIAIEYFGTKISYQGLFERINIVSKAFLEKGVKAGDVVTLALPNTPENLISVYALNQIGAIANIIDLRLKGEKLEKAIKSSNSKFLIGSSLFIDNLKEVIPQTEVSDVIIASPVDSLNPLVRALYQLKEGKVDLTGTGYIAWKQFYESGILSSKTIDHVSKNEDPICILHTSGTTGDSKGVVFSNGNFNAMATQLQYCGFCVEPGHTFFNQVPPFLVYNTLIATHFPLSRGVRMRMNPEYQPDKFYENIYKYKINHTVAGPADWGSFTDHPIAKKRKYDYLMSMVSGSDKINDEKMKEINDIVAAGGSKARVYEGYGMTEVGSAATTNLPQITVPGSVGIPLPNINVCVYDNDEEKELGYGEIGEICFSGPTVMMGYYEKPEATKEVLREHSDGKIWMHSGDLGYMDENGSVYLKGRLKRIIVNHEGFKISPLDLEKIISTLPFVKDCCAIGVEDTNHVSGSVPVVVVSLHDDVMMDIEEVKGKVYDICKQELSARYFPNDVVVRDELPLTPVGKVDYRLLIDEYSSNSYVKKR